MDSRQETTSSPIPAWSLVIFGLAIVGSAFLIFLVQPMVAKRILPWFGGTPAVWMLCLAFYQSALFIGYAYAHALVRWAPPLAQALIHSGVLVMALIALPILPETAEADFSSAPTRLILSLLMAEVAIPFIALAATGPLVQAWFARSHPERSPYPLYALSNIGSMVALFAYPFLIEPNWSLSVGGRGWGIGLGLVAILIIACGLLSTRGPNSVGLDPAETSTDSSPTDTSVMGLWLLLSGAAVVLMMGVSNRLCLDIASIPFLWIFPLSIYLLTFIVAFADERWYRRDLFLAVALFSLLLSSGKGPILDALGLDAPRLIDSIYTEISLFGLLLFASCMVLHGELYRLRPPANRLTLFYLTVSAGGALGGLFVGLVAPAIFSHYFELDVGLALTILGVGVVLYRAHKRMSARRRIAVTLGSVIALALILTQLRTATHGEGELIYQERTFFGVMRVLEMGEGKKRLRRLRHGSTMHGVQFQVRPGTQFPTAYYGRATSLGTVLTDEIPRQEARIGIIGLGVGTVAAYGRPGDMLRFYEIDPAIAAVAGEKGFFSFLSDSAAQIEVEVGDARLVLEREQQGGIQQEFDLLILDAFSSDSIPAHLMTREAFEVYLDTLAPDGLIAVHVSNRHLDLGPIVSRIGHSVGLHSIEIVTPRTPRYQSQLSTWLYLSPRLERITGIERALSRRHASQGLTGETFTSKIRKESDLTDTPLWTDDFADLFSALKPL